jgi:hypothetical protein
VSANLVFILGSGRSGAGMAAKLFDGVAHIEAHHDYVRDACQREAALYFMGLMSKTRMAERLQAIYGAAAHYSPATYFIDSSTKLAWAADVLVEVFPQAKLVHLTRDGRKVSSSFFHKFGGQVYSDHRVKALQTWLARPDLHPMPPPQEDFWWVIPQKGQPFQADFAAFDQFQRCCYQWTESNRCIADALAGIPEARKLQVQLEALTADADEVRRLLDFVDVPFEDDFLERLRRPQDVHVPLDYLLTDSQTTQFKAIGAPMMKRLGYSLAAREYRVDY